MTDRHISLDAAIEVIESKRIFIPDDGDYDIGHECGISSAIEALSALPAVGGWEPIVGCPKNGQIVMLTSDSPLWKYPFPAKWCDKQEWWVFADEWMNDCCAVSDLVSHWQPTTSPLPAPPEIE